jgi:hypothetical protein
VAQTGACMLLRHGHGEAGLELALLFVKGIGDLDPKGGLQQTFFNIDINTSAEFQDIH